MELAVLRRASCTRALLLFFSLSPVIGPQGADAQTSVRRSGVVLDASTRRPVAAVAVTAGNAFTLTSPEGSFTISAPAGVDKVTLTRMGYATLTLSVSAWPSEVVLEPAPLLLEQVAVEVRGGATLASGAALAVSSLDRPALDARGGTSLAEALGSLEGVSDARVGSWGSRPVIRGMAGERLAILIDGNRVNRACTFGMDQGLASIDPGQVERVEVLSGPGSTLFGSGNIGGVINVVTRRERGRGTGGEVRAGASSAVPGGTAGFTFWTGGDKAGLAAALDATSYGDYRTPSATVDGSSYRQLSGDLKVDLTPDPAHRVSLKAQRYEGRDIGWPMMRGAQIPEETRTSFSADYGWQRQGLVDAVTFRAFRQKLDHHMTIDAIMNGAMGPMTVKADAVSWSSTSGARSQLRLAPEGGAFQADVGAEVTRLFAEGTRWSESKAGMGPAMSNTFRVWPAVTVTDAGAFFQGTVRVSEHVEASLGGRLDRVTRNAEERDDVAETVATGNLGLRADLGGGFALRASAGVGYRTPDPMELYGLALKPDGFVYQGTPDLKTERNLSTEVDLSWTGSRASWGLTAFDNDVRDMVSLALLQGETVAGRPVRAYTTVGSATVQGLSANASVLLPGALTFKVEGTGTRGTADASGDPLPAIPPLTGSATLRGDPGARALDWWEVAVRAARAQRRVSAVAGEPTTPGYRILDLRWGLRAGGVDVTAGVENVLDRSYRSHLDPVSLLRPGRNFFVRMSRTF